MTAITWAQVVDNAVKIVVPSLLIATATVIAVFVNRSTELRKDVRRRRQDALERLVDQFESAHAASTQILSAFLTYAPISRENNSIELKHCLREAEVRVRDFMIAKTTLFAIVGRCQMMKLRECAKAIDSYMNVIEDLNDVLEFHGAISKEKAGTAEPIHKIRDRAAENTHGTE